MSEDAELFNRYAAERSEAAFAELTRRHVDMVYSAALRLMAGNIHSAQDVTQQVFTEAARQAKRLARHPAPVGWLYTTTRLMALRINRTEQRRRTREQEANTMNEILHENAPPCDWSQLSPVIEDALHELNDKDRNALLLRFFQNKSLNEVGAGLNLTENAARMRVERALDKLRGKLARRGITTTASALAGIVSANAVQAAPVGFSATISATAIAGASIPMTTLVAATKTILMTTLQKTIVAAASLMLAVGTGIYAVHQSSELNNQIQTLQQKQAPLTAQIRQLEQERNQATGQVAVLAEENTRLKSGQNTKELLKLRGEVGPLRRQVAANEANAAQPTTGLAKLMSDPAMKEYIRQAQADKIRSLYSDFFKEMKLPPEQIDQFLQLFTDVAAKSLAKYSAAAQGTPDQAPADPPIDLPNQLRVLLGDAGFARFQSFSEEIPGRTTVGLLNNQLGETPLSSEQAAQLMQVVKAEPNDLTTGITGAPDKAFLGSQADIDAFLEQVAESNQRVLQQSANFLTADQLTALNNVLTNGINSRKLQGAALIQKH